LLTLPDVDEHLIEALKPHLSFKVILLIGAPCSGKGTQAANLSKLLDIPAVSTGDLFRAEVKTGSELGQKMRVYMEAGQLIPNELTTEFLTEKLGEDEYQKGLILDGYPREQSHLEIFEDIMGQLDRSFLGAIYLEVPEETLRERITGRLVCPACGAISHRRATQQSAPCTVEGCSGSFEHRADDEISVFNRRYEIFQQRTMPLVPEMERRNLLVHVPPLDSSLSVTKRIIGELVQMQIRKSGNISAYKWLDARIPLLENTDAETRLKILREFRDRALVENLSHRSGIMRRFVYLQTTNAKKYKEHVSIFEGLYGIEVLRLPVGLNKEAVEALLTVRAKDLVPLAVIREESNLYRPRSNVFSSLQDGVRAINRATLKATSFSVVSGKYIVREYTHETEGRIDLTRRRTTAQESLGSSAGHSGNSGGSSPSPRRRRPRRPGSHRLRLGRHFCRLQKRVHLPPTPGFRNQTFLPRYGHLRIFKRRRPLQGHALPRLDGDQNQPAGRLLRLPRRPLRKQRVL
jgi:adenylate kinase